MVRVVSICMWMFASMFIGLMIWMCLQDMTQEGQFALAMLGMTSFLAYVVYLIWCTKGTKHSCPIPQDVEAPDDIVDDNTCIAHDVHFSSVLQESHASRRRRR